MSNQLPQLKGLKMHEIRLYLGILGHVAFGQGSPLLLAKGRHKEVDTKAPSSYLQCAQLRSCK